MKKGIVVAGNIVADKIKIIDQYPVEGMLSDIKSISFSTGGCVPNVGIALKRIDESLPITAIGRVGKDIEGEIIVGKMQEFGINVSNVLFDSQSNTSFTDVMASKEGTRTFFHSKGANSKFSLEDINFSEIQGDIFHIGYALILDAMDASHEEYGTNLAYALKLASEKGFKTSLDVVSEQKERFKLMIPALQFCDYLIVNEIEAGAIAQLNPRTEDGKILKSNLKKTCEILFEKGVKDMVYIHFPEGAVLMRKDGKYFEISSLRLPNEYIKGTVGAGDSFCAGVLYSIYKGWDELKTLRFATAVAAHNLSKEDSTSGIVSCDKVLDIEKKFSRGDFN